MISLAQHMNACETAVRDKFHRDMSPAENDLAVKSYETLKKAETPSAKRAEPTEKTTVEKRLGEGMFSDKINEPGTVSKSIRSFLPDGEQEIDAVEAFLESVTFTPEDATVEPQYSPTRFISGTVPMVADGTTGGPVSPTPYLRRDFVGAQPAVRLGNNYVLPNADPNIAPPADFDEPVPANRPVGGPASDFDEDGNPIFGNDSMDLDDNDEPGVAKRLIFKARRANKSLFGNIVVQRGTEGNAV